MILKQIIDFLEAKATQEVILEQVWIFLGIAFVSGVFKFAMRQTTVVVSRKIEFEFLNDYLKHLQSLPISFFNKNRTGDLMALGTNDLSSVRSVLGPGIMYTTNTTVTFFTALYFMIGISPTLTLFALLPFPLMSILTWSLIRINHKNTAKKQEQFGKINSTAQENLSGIRVIKAYVQEALEIQKFDKLSFDYLKKNMAVTIVSGGMHAGLAFLTALGFCGILWVGGKMVIANEITLGSFVAFNTYLTMLVWPMIAFGWVMNIFQQGYTSLGRINKVLHTSPEAENVLERLDKNSPIDIEFRNVSFNYEPNEIVLRNINLKIPAGTSVGIVGKIGSGKTSLVNLISRLYEVSDGEILLNGKNIQSYSLKDVREIVGCVLQETFLFSDSIANNIRFGVPEKEMDKVIETAELSQLKANIDEFPLKFETILGERGITLSGGQKQRTAIARALIKEPKILILDDSLSAVDTQTEDEILKGLKKVMENRTTLIVAHRISTVQNCDKIVVLENGKISEEGTHDELLALEGTYFEFHERQLLQEELVETE